MTVSSTARHGARVARVAAAVRSASWPKYGPPSSTMARITSGVGLHQVAAAAAAGGGEAAGRLLRTDRSVFESHSVR